MKKAGPLTLTSFPGIIEGYPRLSRPFPFNFLDTNRLSNLPFIIPIEKGSECGQAWGPGKGMERLKGAWGAQESKVQAGQNPFMVKPG